MERRSQYLTIKYNKEYNIYIMQNPTTEGKDMETLVVETTVEETETDTLNATDRCDSCSAQAYVWVNGISGDLLFCGHHFSKSEEKIRAYAFEIIDERHKLSVKRESSAANSD
jgi:hypothetical protein